MPIQCDAPYYRIACQPSRAGERERASAEIDTHTHGQMGTNDRYERMEKKPLTCCSMTSPPAPHEFSVYKGIASLQSASNHIQLFSKPYLSFKSQKQNKTVKMKFLIVFAAVVAVAFAAPQGHPANPDAQATIINQQADIDPQGNYQAA